MGKSDSAVMGLIAALMGEVSGVCDDPNCPNCAAERKRQEMHDQIKTKAELYGMTNVIEILSPAMLHLLPQLLLVERLHNVGFNTDKLSQNLVSQSPDGDMMDSAMEDFELACGFILECMSRTAKALQLEPNQPMHYRCHTHVVEARLILEFTAAVQARFNDLDWSKAARKITVKSS